MRQFLTALALICLAAGPVAAQGLHTEDWFAVTFKDVAEDIETAAAEGKRLAIIFEQEGCIYCKKLHEEVLSDAEVADYIKANFVVVQMNLWGRRGGSPISTARRSRRRRWPAAGAWCSRRR